MSVQTSASVSRSSGVCDGVHAPSTSAATADAARGAVTRRRLFIVIDDSTSGRSDRCYTSPSEAAAMSFTRRDFLMSSVLASLGAIQGRQGWRGGQGGPGWHAWQQGAAQNPPAPQTQAPA